MEHVSQVEAPYHVGEHQVVLALAIAEVNVGAFARVPAVLVPGNTHLSVVARGKITEHHARTVVVLNDPQVLG